MKIPLNAPIECTDGMVGRSEYVLINPVIDQVTHLVVKENADPNTEYIVPVEMISETNDELIRLHCSKAELEKMDPFIKMSVIEENIPEQTYLSEMYGTGTYFYIPYVTPERMVYETVADQQIPMGELAVRRGTRVEATDGDVGHVDEFVVDQQNGKITHLVLREGHLWGKKDVLIPVTALGDTRDDTVYLKIDKQEIESLPTFPVHRHWS